jgi:AraC family transcriptional regulator
MWVCESVPDNRRFLEANFSTRSANMQIWNSHVGRRAQARFAGSDSCLLDFSLGRRNPSGRVRYPTSQGTKVEPLGQLALIVPGHEVVAEAEAGVQRSLFWTFSLKDLSDAGMSTLLDRDSVVEASLRSAAITESMLRISRELLAPGFASPAYLEAASEMLIIELERHFRLEKGIAAEDAPGSLAPWQMRAIRERIRSEAPPPALSELAELCGITPRHLMRTFKNSTGQTVGSFITVDRIDKAKNLLANSRTPIKQVSHRLGFQSSASFSVAFRRATGLSPKRFRQFNGI